MSGSSTFFARPIFPAKICRPSSFAQFSGLMSYIVGQIASIFSHILQFFPKLGKKKDKICTKIPTWWVMHPMSYPRRTPL